MLHHVSFAVADLERSAAFYDAVLGALGYQRIWSDPAAIGYGFAGAGDEFAIKLRGPKEVVVPGPGFHLAFSAPDRDSVAHFFSAALAAGGKDNGAPGLRPHYGPDYFAAFARANRQRLTERSRHAIER